MKRLEGTFESENNLELFYQSWVHEEPKGSLVIAHGFAEHSESYNRLAQGISDLKLNVHVLDFQGHGQSPGPRGYVDSFSSFTRDLHRFISFLEENSSLLKPSFLLGHSMGGLIVLTYVLENPGHPFQKIVLSSPLLGFKLPISPIKEKIAELLNRWAPQITLPHGIKIEDLSRDPQVVESHKKDYLRHEKIAPSTFFGMKSALDVVHSKARKIKDPLFFQVAGADNVVDLEKTKLFFQNLPNDEKKMIIYKDSFHEVYNDSNRSEVYEDLKQFLKGELS